MSGPYCVRGPVSWDGTLREEKKWVWTYSARSRHRPLQLWLHSRQPAPQGYDVAAVTDISIGIERGETQ